jgi:hypothetical protein
LTLNGQGIRSKKARPRQIALGTRLDGFLITGFIFAPLSASTCQNLELRARPAKLPLGTFFECARRRRSPGVPSLIYVFCVCALLADEEFDRPAEKDR